MIVVTGGNGFIGKNLINELNIQFSMFKHLVNLDTEVIPLFDVYRIIEKYADKIEVIFHLGAITDTTENNPYSLDTYNTECSKTLWRICVEHDIPFIYASSAATYGDGSNGFDDKIDSNILRPLNLYGKSKNNFDIWVRNQTTTPTFWYGLKFFNVYGFGESHKGKMASVMYHFYQQINTFGKIRLFKSLRDDIMHGEQKRDFVYVDDIVKVLLFLFIEKPKSDIYNVGTGVARSYNDVAENVFNAMGLEPKILYIDMPDNLINGYQYFTEAKMDKLREIGYVGHYKEFISLEVGIRNYINKLIRYENS